MTLVLLVTNFRLILENLLKYGILTNPTRWIFLLVPEGEPALSAGNASGKLLSWSTRCRISKQSLSFSEKDPMPFCRQPSAVPLLARAWPLLLVRAGHREAGSQTP